MEYDENGRCVAGVDEAGRGPLAGPVVAAAVILDPARPIEGLSDSKKLAPRRREVLCELIMEHALAYGVGRADPAEIDAVNILQASLRAMQRAVMALGQRPECVWVDGDHVPRLPYPVQAIVKGDEKVASISAASIVAKVLRDREMLTYAEMYPHYGFERHKGYPTRDHVAALKAHGVLPIHRKSFGPVAVLL